LANFECDDNDTMNLHGELIHMLEKEYLSE
jgi:hypothetical protein